MESSPAPVTLAQLSAKAQLSESQTQRLFKKCMGCTPKQYSNTLQRIRVQQQLLNGTCITDALYAAGFESASRFYARADAMLGMLPKQYQKRGKGAVISYATANTDIGELIVAATGVGICYVGFGESNDALVKQLQHNFQQAYIHPGNDEFNDMVQTVSGLVASADKSSALDRVRALPMDIKGTVFQEKVWRVLSGIPSGETMTYNQVAQAIGHPKSFRAVANACGANPVALIIPCHRVVRSDGGFGGYRWGMEIKERLLASERGR